MTKKIKQFLKTRGGVILFFTLFLLYGLLTVKDYGISTDELIERESSLITYRYMVPSVSELVTETVNFPELTPLEEYKDRYYGMAVQIPAVVVEHLFGFRLDIRKVFLMRHLYNFLMFFAAALFFYKLCRKLGHGRGMSVLGVSILILTPRILAHAYYNIKDMMFLSVFVITLYFGFLCVERFSWRRLIPFAFFGALCTNIRIVGAMVVAVCLTTAFVKSLTEKRWRRTFCYCWAGAGLCFGFYYVMTPIIWHDTWRQLLSLMDTFSNYVVWYTHTYFMGDYILSTELPWYYLFVNIGITTPVFYLAMFVCGGIGLLAKGGRKLAVRRRPEGTDWFYLCLSVNVTVPFVYVLVSRPVLYNGWRHFYFVYPMMVLVMLYGIAALGRLAWNGWERKSEAEQSERIRTGKKFLLAGRVGETLRHPLAVGWGCVTAACILSTAVWIGRNHPHEYVFFNRIALPYVTEYFQKDYWNVSQYELLRYACERDGRQELKVWVLPENAIVFMPPEHRNRIRHVAAWNDADYIVTAYTASWEEERLDQYYLYDEWKAVWVDGIKISSLFRRSYDPSLRIVLEENRNCLRYNINGMDWEISYEGDETVLHGTSLTELTADKLFIQGSDGDLMEGLRIWVSEDGEHYTELETEREIPSAETDRVAFYRGQPVTDILIRHKTAESAAFSVSLLAWRGTGEEAAAPVSMIESAFASAREDQADLAWDGNLESRWTSGKAQEESMYYELRLKEERSLQGMILDTYSSAGDEGKNLSVFGSRDGKNWNKIEASTEDGIRYDFAPVSCRYLRLEVGGTDAGNINNWSIHEISLMTETEAR